MTDSIDTTQADLDRAHDAAIRRHRSLIESGAGRPASPRAGMTQDAQTPSAMVCATCGNRIPDARRKAVQGTQHCVHCAAHITRGPR